MSIDEAQNEPSSWSKQVIRLGCLHCDRDDFDGVLMLPDDWHGIHALQAWEQSVCTDPFQDEQSCKESGRYPSRRLSRLFPGVHSPRP